jgi:gluconate 2-dehydrogenase gamma chain
MSKKQEEMAVDFTRRDIVRNAALGAMLGGVSERLMADVHMMAQADAAAGGGVYKPKVFSASEWATLRRLCELIIPADAVSKGALEAGVPEYIDLLASGSSELATRMAGGLHWLDSMAQKRAGKTFLAAGETEQTALLDAIAYRKNPQGEMATGVAFFDLARRMTVDAFYTSKVGIADVGYRGNKGMTKFEVPLAALEYATKRSPV